MAINRKELNEVLARYFWSGEYNVHYRNWPKNVIRRGDNLILVHPRGYRFDLYRYLARYERSYRVAKRCLYFYQDDSGYVATFDGDYPCYMEASFPALEWLHDKAIAINKEHHGDLMPQRSRIRQLVGHKMFHDYVSWMPELLFAPTDRDKRRFAFYRKNKWYCLLKVYLKMYNGDWAKANEATWNDRRAHEAERDYVRKQRKQQYGLSTQD